MGEPGQIIIGTQGPSQIVIPPDEDETIIIGTPTKQILVDLPNEGVRGPQGLKGDKGDKGDTGEKGDKGDTGGTQVEFLLTDPDLEIPQDANLPLALMYFRIGQAFDSHTVITGEMAVNTAAVSGTTTVNVWNVRTGGYVFSTPITIDPGELDSTDAVTAVPDPSHNVVYHTDQLRIDLLTAGVGAQGIMLDLQFSPEVD